MDIAPASPRPEHAVSVVLAMLAKHVVISTNKRRNRTAHPTVTPLALINIYQLSSYLNVYIV